MSTMAPPNFHSSHNSPTRGSHRRTTHIKYRSIISDVFDGKLLSSVQCLTCNRISTRMETFQDLSLPIPSKDHLTMLHQGSVNIAKCAELYSTDQGWLAWLWEWVCSLFWGPTVGLHDCLQAFFSADELKGDNMYSCEKCNKLRNGVKYSKVLELPEVLCIHLKRFRHELMFSSKISNYVTFPLEDLDLKPYLHKGALCQGWQDMKRNFGPEDKTSGIAARIMLDTAAAGFTGMEPVLTADCGVEVEMVVEGVMRREWVTDAQCTVNHAVSTTRGYQHSRMYGLLLENLSEYIKQVYGEDKWEEIRRLAQVDAPSFSVHQVYPENLIPRLAKKAIQVLGVTEREFFDQMGVHFVGFVGQYGYDRVLSVLGRHMRDFLNGLDNLHEYLKFSYPRMRAPSFICENETRQGLTLHYRSKRRGFVYYTMGQIREVARHFYHKEMRIELVREEVLFDTVHVTFQLTFDNRAFTLASLTLTREEKHLPISASVLFEIFPFCIVFGSDMVVRSIGNSLMVILPDLVGKKITNWFDLVRPLIAFKFQSILNRTNNIFELVTVEPVLGDSRHRGQELELHHDEEVVDEKSLRLKGQMIYMDNWRMMMYLGTPVMPDLNSLVSTGLYINDLSMHDFSRDLMLAGTQQSVELKLALDQEQQKSKKLEESMRKLDEEMRRTDELLYQMIPKQVADRLRTGENPIDTCQMFDSVSILFSDVVTFTEICSRITPMEVVSMLNAMYSIFDTLTERNKVYKVETIGDAYMVVSGAPQAEDNHAEKVCDMALDMVEAITDLKDPSTGSHLQIRVGVHSGAVVAGIVGLKMPRYCLFGDSVNTASRMESTSEAMRIHISQSTKDLLPPEYVVKERGEIQVKGKGNMKTYWLVEREHRIPLSRTIPARESVEAPEWEKCADDIKNLQEDRARVYSPVTFQEVARRSVDNSPVKLRTDNREFRSTSVIAVHTGSFLQSSLATETPRSHSPCSRRISSPCPQAERRPSVHVTAPPPDPVPGSRSDGCLSKKAELNRSTHSLLSQQQQCCAGFPGSPGGKHSHSCDIV